MRRSDLYLITRFLTWPAAWVGLLVLVVAGLALKSCEKSSKHNDVCFGLVEYNLESKRDRNKLRKHIMENPSAIRMGFNRRPCDFYGPKVDQKTQNAIYRIVSQSEE